MKLLITLLLTTFIGGSVVVLQPPLGLDMYMPVPEANPLTREKVMLGRKLFFDKRLSRDGTLACANCHDPQRGFSDGHRTQSLGRVAYNANSHGWKLVARSASSSPPYHTSSGRG